MIQKDFGSRHEQTTISSYEKQTKKTVQENNAKFYKREVGRTVTSNGRTVLVGGRTDGVVEDKVIEVKNRIKRLPENIPDYDIAQLNVYLFLAEKQRGEMVETLRAQATGDDGASASPQQRVTPFEFESIVM